MFALPMNDKLRLDDLPSDDARRPEQLSLLWTSAFDDVHPGASLLDPPKGNRRMRSGSAFSVFQAVGTGYC